jgi:NAD-dependent DNA ligase
VVEGHLWCSSPECPAQQLARVKHFVDVCLKGIGGATVEALGERGWLPNPAGLYKLTQVGLHKGDWTCMSAQMVTGPTCIYSLAL